MKTTTMPVADLKHPARNVRKHPENQIREMVRSIEMFGQIRPVVIDENNEVLAGNGLLLALRQMGAETANVLKMSDLSETQKKKLMIADNRIYSLGFDDGKTVMDFIGEMTDFEVPGYDQDLLKELMADVDTVDEAIESFGVLSEEEEENFAKAAESNRQAIELAQRTPPREVDFNPTAERQETADVARSLKCPHCGETVWL